MRLRSLGYQTDLIFPRFDGEIVDRGDYMVIRTPANPGFFWGNFLLFSEPPKGDDFNRWRELFREEIGTPPEVRHQTFGWDSADGDTGLSQPFLDAGFRLERSEVMTMDNLQPPRRPSKIVTIRTLQSEAEWDEALENQVICREPEFDEVEYRAYRRLQMARCRRMVAANLGDWYGAFIDDRLVADLGIFHGDGIGRYQMVQTHPDFRGQGIAGTMVYEAARQALAKHDLQTLVIVADESSAPARLYQSVGFKPLEIELGLEWWDGMTPSDGSK
jgi:GNAT superfamily N-acetyltransferase